METDLIEPATSLPAWQTQRRSTSQRRTYRTCGHKFLHQYAGGWKPIRDRGTYAFGHVMQEVADLILLRLITEPGSAEAIFLDKWSRFEGDPSRTWTSRASWGTLKVRGAALARLMARELPQIIGKPDPSHLDEQFTYDCGGVEELVRPDFYGPVVDLLGDTAGIPQYVPAVLDFKTSERRYHPTSAELDEQLTDYQCAEESLGRPVAMVGLVVLIYAVKPEIQWLLQPARDDIEKRIFMENAVRTDQMIRGGVFVRNPGACFTRGECPYTPLCYPSQQYRIDQELKTYAPPPSLIIGAAPELEEAHDAAE